MCKIVMAGVSGMQSMSYIYIHTHARTVDIFNLLNALAVYLAIHGYVTKDCMDVNDS